MWAGLPSPVEPCQNRAQVNVPTDGEENQCLSICLCMKLILHSSVPLSVHPQLLPLPAAGGCRGLENQAELLGVKATRSKSQQILIFGFYEHIHPFPVLFIFDAVKVLFRLNVCGQCSLTRLS